MFKKRSHFKLFSILGISLLTSIGVLTGISFGNKGVEKASAESNFDVYFTCPNWWAEYSGSTYLYTSYRMGDGDWGQSNLSLETSTFKGYKVYKGTVKEKYGGLNELKFIRNADGGSLQPINGWDLKGTIEGYMYDYSNVNSLNKVKFVADTYTKVTTYCAVDLESGRTIKANYQLVGDGAWKTVTGVDTGKTLNGTKVYSFSLDTLGEGLQVLQFQIYNGSSFVEQKEAFNSWWTFPGFQNKIYIYSKEKFGGSEFKDDAWYLMGLNGDWATMNDSNKLDKDGSNYKKEGVYLAANTELKIKDYIDGETGDNHWHSASSATYYNKQGQSSSDRKVSVLTGGNVKVEDAGTYDITLYPDGTNKEHFKFEQHKWTINYNKGAYGTGTNTSDTKYDGDSLTLKGEIFTRDGWSQTGWSTTDGGAKAFNLSASYTTEGNATLYPYWEQTIKYTVSFDMQGLGTASKPADQKVLPGGKVTKPTDPSETGYTFGGWYKESGCTNAWNFDTDTVSGDRTLYAKWTINQHTVTFINSDERGGQTTKSYDYNTTVDVSDFSKISAIFDGNLNSEPLGRHYVGLKLDASSSETPLKQITVTENKTYYVSYSFDDASLYTFSFDGINYTSLDAHRDSGSGESYLQVYYTTTDASFTSGQTFHLKYNNVEITKDSTNPLTYDESSNIASNGKVRATGTGNVTVRFIYNNGGYSYQVYLGGLPNDNKYYISVDGILTELSKSTTADEYYIQGIQIEKDNVVNAYCNGFYGEIWLDESVDSKYFTYNTETKMIECQLSGSYDAYLKKENGQYKKYYLAPHGLKDAQDFAEKFHDDICEQCELIVAHDPQGIAKLQQIWASNKAAYDLLDSSVKGWLVKSSTDEKISEMFLSYRVAYSKNAQNLQAQGGDFLHYYGEDANRMLLSNHQRNIFTDNDSNNTVLIIIISSVSLLTLAGASLLIIKKRKH